LGTPAKNLIDYVWGDVIYYLKIFLLFLAIAPIVKIISNKLKIKNITYLGWLISFIGLFLYITVTSQLHRESFILSFWPNTILENSYFSILIFFLISLIAKNRPLEKTMMLFLFICLFSLSLASVGAEHFVQYEKIWHIIALFIFLAALFCLAKAVFLEKKNKRIKNEHIIFLSIILNLSYFAYYVRFVTNGKSPEEINSNPAIISFLSPLIIAFLLLHLAKANKIKPVTILIFMSLLLTNIFSQINKTDNTVIYSYQDLQKATQFLNEETKETDLIFTADTALAAEAKPVNILKIASPWVYRDTDFPFFCKENDTASFCLSKNEIALSIKEQKPKYIIGSSRITSWTFLDENFDRSNYEINQVLKTNYEHFITINKFTFYKIKD